MRSLPPHACLDIAVMASSHASCGIIEVWQSTPHRVRLQQQKKKKGTASHGGCTNEVLALRVSARQNSGARPWCRIHASIVAPSTIHPWAFSFMHPSLHSCIHLCTIKRSIHGRRETLESLSLLSLFLSLHHQTIHPWAARPLSCSSCIDDPACTHAVDASPASTMESSVESSMTLDP